MTLAFPLSLEQVLGGTFSSPQNSVVVYKPSVGKARESRGERRKRCNKAKHRLSSLRVGEVILTPQNPNFEQQTFKGHVELSAHLIPNPGSHWDFRVQSETQSVPQTRAAGDGLAQVLAQWLFIIGNVLGGVNQEAHNQDQTRSFQTCCSSRPRTGLRHYKSVHRLQRAAKANRGGRDTTY